LSLLVEGCVTTLSAQLPILRCRCCRAVQRQWVASVHYTLRPSVCGWWSCQL